MSMFDGEQFGRSYVLEVADIKVQSIGVGQVGLAIEFEVVRDDSPIPNQATVRIYNLAPNTRERLEQMGEVTCRLQAGYKSNYAQIFYGVLGHIRSQREGTSIITTLEAADRAENAPASSKIHRTYAKGTKLVDVIKGFARLMNLGSGNLDTLTGVNIDGAQELPRAYTANGDAGHELDRLCKSAGLLWCIHEGGVYVYKASAPIGVTANVLRPIETPKTDTKTGIVTVRSLLMPEVVPGYAVPVESEKLKGKFLVKSTRHVGASHGGEWTLEAELLP
jgi:hypothetical protein